MEQLQLSPKITNWSFNKTYWNFFSEWGRKRFEGNMADGQVAAKDIILELNCLV